MERKIGERFDFKGKTLEVVEEIDGCENCYFEKNGRCEHCYFEKSGRYDGAWACTVRSDGKSVIFKEIDGTRKLLIKAHAELIRCGIESEIVQEIEGYLKTTTSGKTI